MNNKIFCIFVIYCFLVSCARVYSPQVAMVATEESANPVDSIDIANFVGPKQKVMVFPWNISKVDLGKYPILRDNRIGFGVSNRLTDILFDVNRFEFIEEKQEIAAKLVQQMLLCKTSDVCQDGGIKNLQLKTADYIIYPEVYHFGIEKHTDITGIDTSNSQYVEIGIQIKIVNAHTATTESIGSFIGQKELTSQGDIFNNPSIDFSQSALGKATDAAIKGAIAKMLNRFDKIAEAKPQSSSLSKTKLINTESRVNDVSQRSSSGTKKSIISGSEKIPLSIPGNYPQKRLA